MANIRTLFHFTSFAAYAYTCWFDYHLVSGEYLPITDNFFSKFVWLTMIDLYLQTGFHIFGIFASFGKKNETFDFVAKVLAGPIGLTVVFLFWMLFFLDPDFLLHDENARRILSITWYNNAIHTLPALTVLVDGYLWNHGQVKKSNALKAITIFAVLYIIDIHYVHHISGFWAYPILGQLPLPARALFILACVTVIFIFYIVLDSVSGMLHGGENKKKGKKN